MNAFASLRPIFAIAAFAACILAPTLAPLRVVACTHAASIVPLA